MEAGRILTAPEGVGPITVAGATLTHGTNVVGEGAIAMPFGELTIRESVLTENTVHGAGTGGAVNMEGRTLNIIDSSITANSAAEGGRIFLKKTSLSLQRSTVAGGAIAAVEGGGEPVIATDSTITGNSAHVIGGGIALVNASAGILRFATVPGNTAPTGAGICGNNAALSGEDSILSGNAPEQCAGMASATATGSNIVFGSSSCLFTMPR